ncbi:type I polyketide synthase [Streptomyces sp. NPDC001941]|uniref:type I polyketide synthase n=1 Tax=Streptomyces sp. NPDC001941 TaxID=3154659 RepID=UPI0033203129
MNPYDENPDGLRQVNPYDDETPGGPRWTDPYPGGAPDGPGQQDGVAIIGLACRFPGADTPERFWRNLVEGVESVDVEEAEDSAEGTWVRSHATLDGIDRFDAGFFGFSPREAALLDPQHRLFLEVCWEALEDGSAAGSRGVPGIGVYGGSGTSLYLMNHLRGQASRPAANFLDSTEDLQLAMAAERDYLASRVAYKLDLDGPTVSVQAACATSLYALHLACQALLAGECDLALAGGSHVPVPQIDRYRPEPGLVVSHDGHCRAFDARATGTVFGSGVGAVLLKPYAQALADGDRVYAVVRGTAVNNDGAGKPGFSAPSVAGQAAVIRQALAAADVDPRTVSYVEAHGTATPIGDPIEVAALSEAFEGARAASCAIGSVKTNIGHLSWAGGIAGVIKTALALHHRTLPASLHYERPNPAIDFAASPFYVQSATEPWPAGEGPRRAGVSAFGLGGTNAHAVLEEAAPPPSATGVAGDAREPVHVLPLSARDDAALRELAARTGRALRAPDGPAPADAALTLGAGRRHFPYRAAVVGSDSATLATLLEAVADGDEETPDRLDGEIGLVRGKAAAPARAVALFSGQGGEYLEGCRDLYEAEPAFRAFLDAADPHFERHTGQRLTALLYQDPARRGTPLTDIRLAQPAVYVLQVALARLWSGWGLEPQVVLGHSLGEYAAAHTAGVFSFEDGLRLVCERGRLLSSLPDTVAMAAVFADEARTNELLAGLDTEGTVSIAALNAPQRTAISGDRAAVDAAVAEAERQGITCRRLRIAVAAHSALLDGILDSYEAVLATVEMRPPVREIISTLTGRPAGPEMATPAYWRRQLREPVRFVDAVRAAARGAGDVFVEIGLSHTLAGLAQLSLDPGPGNAPPAFLETLRWERDDLASTRLALAGAYAAGLDVDWRAAEPHGRLTSLPTYPFQRERHWIPRAAVDAPAARVDGRALGALDLPVTRHPHAGPVGHWVLGWDEAPEPDPATEPTAGTRCLVLAPSLTDVAPVVRELERRGADVRVHLLEEGSDAVTEAAKTMAVFRPHTVLNAVPALRKRHADRAGLPTATGSVEQDVRGAGGLAALQAFQALSEANLTRVRVCTVTAGAHRVLAEDDAIPAQGAVVGIARTARTEYSTLRHLLVDLDAVGTRQDWAGAAGHLAAALELVPDGDAELAVRAGRVLLPRLRPALPPARDEEPRLDPAGWYLVVGGLSGVGLECARALLEGGATRLLLCGRRLPDSAKTAELKRLAREFGAEIRTEPLDVSCYQQVEQLLRNCVRDGRELRGVVNAAGVLDDAIIDRTDWDRIARVLGPKAQGAWNLHRAAARYAPDLALFAMASSYGGLFGNPGQAGHAAANTFLDALAGHRRALGLPGLALDLGSWSDVGVLAGDREFLADLERRGVGTISAAEGRPVVRAALTGWPSGQVAVLPTRWDALDPEDHLASNPVLHGVAGARTGPSGPAEPDAPAGRPLTGEEVLAHCCRVVSAVLGYPEPELAGLDLPGAGMDSLNALTIRNKLQRLVSVPLPAAICFENPTPEALAADIERRVASEAAQEQAREAAGARAHVPVRRTAKEDD